MPPEPLYHTADVRPAFELRYSWTGWLVGRPLGEVATVLKEIEPHWCRDGIRLLEHSCSDKRLQLTFSATPVVAPAFLAGRAKGRLQHFLRRTHPDFSGFSRKVSVRSVGHNCREQVEAYIVSQVDAAQFGDPSFAKLMKEFTVVCGNVDLAKATDSAHGRYWYNLHLVLVTAERYRVADRARLTNLRDTSFRIARKKGHQISRLSLMPDHLHLALRGNLQHSPRDIAMAFQNNLAHALGQVTIWADTYYAGTFGEYDMWAIRRNTPHT